MLLSHFSGGSDGKEFTCNTSNPGSISGLERFPGGSLGNPLQYSCLENPHQQRILESCSSWGLKESDKTEWLNSTALHLSIPLSLHGLLMNNTIHLHGLSAPVLSFCYMIQNTIDVSSMASTKHQKWKSTVKKKFIFIYRYKNSCIDNEETAIWLFMVV